MKYRKPHFIEPEQIPLAILLGAFLGTGLGLYISPTAILLFSVLGGVIGGSILTILLLNQKEKLVIKGRQPPQLSYPTRKSSSANSLPAFRQEMPGQQPLRIGTVPLSPAAETGNIFIVGRPGSGKSQAILQLLEGLRNRTDVRVVILDRSGELIERLYRPTDLLFNPLDERSAGWCHTHELQYLSPQAIASSFLPVPQQGENAIWYEYAQLLLAAIWQKCFSNHEVRQVLQSNQSRICQWVQGTRAVQCFDDPRLASSVLLTLTPATHFYDYWPDGGEDLSFFGYGRGRDPRWMFLTLFEEQTDLLKTPMSAAVDLIIRGVLSRETNSTLKTVVVIDELGALQKLPSLRRFLSEGRKYGGCAVLGTQTEAQINEIYGKEETRILLQNTRTKLILNCPDPETAQLMAEIIGKHQVWQRRFNQEKLQVVGSSWDPVEEYAVPPYILQMLPDLTGYVLLGDESPAIQTKITISVLNRNTPRFKARLSQTRQLLSSTIGIQGLSSLENLQIDDYNHNI